MTEETDTAEPGGAESGSSAKTWLRWSGFLVFLMVYAWAYTYLGTVLILEKNVSRIGNVQATYIDAVYQAAALREGRLENELSLSSRFTRALPQYTDGIIDPLWPWLSLAFADEPPDALFEKGKWLNMLLSCGLLVLFGLAAARAFSFAGAAAIILMGGFGVILERSAYFSSDAVYYLLVVVAWMCALSLIRQNRLWLYGVFGALLGLVYLAKAPVWPIALGFLLVSGLRTVAELIRAKRKPETESLWSNPNQLVGLAMFATTFLLVTGPRLSYANSHFGDSFHNYAKYFVWLDTPREASQFRQAYPGKEQLSSLSAEQKPGLVRFVEKNGARELFRRGFTGASAQLGSSLLGRKTSGRILVYTCVVFCVVAGIHRWVMWRRQSEEIWRVRGTSARWMLLFLVLVLGLTLFYAGIGNQIIPSNSIITALFLPILLTFIWIAERYRRQLQRSSQARLVNLVYGGLMSLAIVWIAIKIATAVSRPVVG